jgi:hypothetical protein
MHQIKLFKGYENDLAAIEKEVNNWLASSNAKVIQMFGNVAPQSPKAEGGHLMGAERAGGRGFIASDIFLAVMYEK